MCHVLNWGDVAEDEVYGTAAPSLVTNWCHFGTYGSGDGKEFDWNSFMRDCGVQQYLHCPDQSSNFPWSGWPLWRLMVALTEESEANILGFSVGDVSANMLQLQAHYWKECHTLDHYMQHADQFLFTKKIPSCWLLIQVNFVCQPWIDTFQFPPSQVAWQECRTWGCTSCMLSWKACIY